MGKLTDKPHTVIVEDEIIPLVHFLAVVVNILLTLPQAGRVPRELVLLFVMLATSLSCDLVMLTEE